MLFFRTKVSCKVSVQGQLYALKRLNTTRTTCVKEKEWKTRDPEGRKTIERTRADESRGINLVACSGVT